ncbi:MAG: S8 family peptidase [Bacteroidota bacterium]|nr:S8 family peptidase [Bacteroidota bacterium]
MNRLTKPFLLSSVMAVALVGCTSTSRTALNVSSHKALSANGAVAKKTEIKESDLQRWSHLDLIKDSIPGMSVDRAYTELIKGAKGQRVIVGVIDSGIDIKHPDLEASIWKNPKEKAANGKDDDNNGYVDDLYGWNFLGNSNHENYEFVRILKKGDDGSEDYKRALAELEKNNLETQSMAQQCTFLRNIYQTIVKRVGKEDFTIEDLNKIEAEDEELKNAKLIMTKVVESGSLEDYLDRLKRLEKYIDMRNNYYFNQNFNGRKPVGDDPNNIKDTKYGNADVLGPDAEEALHGTHVAGIIAQTRANGIGGDGVYNNVEIMSLRAVPDGDEYDKDIALAIRYAADNGAKVINGSFGKYYSPHKQWVIDAMKYAASKDVLIVIAAGNDAYDLDETNKYPNDSYNGDPEYSDNVLIVGALNYSYSDEMLASFTNYGKRNVDVFAPGVKIYATAPLGEYKYLQGTSMASPNAAGVAAMIRSYYPSLTAKQVKKVLMDSSIKPSIEVTIVDGKTDKSIKKPFAEFSVSGGIVNAYNAMILASKMVNGK